MVAINLGAVNILREINEIYIKPAQDVLGVRNKILKEPKQVMQ